MVGDCADSKNIICGRQRYHENIRRLQNAKMAKKKKAKKKK